MDTDDVISYLIAFGTAVLLLWFLRRVAFRIDLLDQPGERKDHQGAVPLIGGLAMFLAFSFAALTLAAPIAHLRSFFMASALLVVVGVSDDLHELSSGARFLAQITAALLMSLHGGVVLHDLGAIGPQGGMAVLGDWSVPLTVFATVGVINALNMSDGIDGLAGSLSLMTALSLALIAWIGGDVGAVRILLLLAAVIVAFLLFNLRSGRRRALVFMGDAGSMFLGFVLAWFFIHLSQGGERLMTPATALWIFAVPLIDTVSQMLRRILKGRSPFSADRGHFHHILMLAGFSPRQTLGIILAVTAVTTLIGLGGLYGGVPEAVMFYGFLGLFALYFLTIMRAWKLRRFIRRSISRRKKVPDQRFEGDRRRPGAGSCKNRDDRRGAIPDRRVGVADRRMPRNSEE